MYVKLGTNAKLKRKIVITVILYNSFAPIY